MLNESKMFLLDDRSKVCHRTDLQLSLIIIAESNRLVSRLSHIMAWALAQKALASGECHPEQMNPGLYSLPIETDFRLLKCPEYHLMPKALLALLDRSQRLYLQVVRVDERMRHSLSLAET